MSNSSSQEQEENDASSAQFTAILLRYLSRRAEQAQRRARSETQESAAAAADEKEEDLKEDEGVSRDDVDDVSASDDPFSSDDALTSWGSFFGKRKTKSQTKLDLIDDYCSNNEITEECFGRLQQWIDDGHQLQLQIKVEEYEQIAGASASVKHAPLICNNKHYGSCHTFLPHNFHNYISLRELGACCMISTRGAISHCWDHFFFNNVSARMKGASRVFCSDFSVDGNVVCVASQDHVIHLIDSSSGINSARWRIYKQVESQFSGWSIIDVALSPHHEFVAYSGWSSSIFLVNTYGSHELHEEHNLNISSFNSWGRCCVFGIEFDPNSKKVICALSGGCLILHDLERKINEFSIPSAHDDDINQATFLDTNTIISGSDDALLRVWDRRKSKKCVGGFVGHYQGITCVSTPNDYGSSLYVLSNSKDQSMKLWDLRCMNNLSQLTSTRAQLQPSTGSFDYRYRGWNPATSATHKKKFRIDKSLVTYRGHSVERTLCRSGFSPVANTSAKYVYCGSSDGAIYIYDTLTAKLFSTLRAHSDIVRDVCWHPFLPIIVSASWDGSVVMWSYRGSNKEGSIRKKKKKKDEDDDDDDSFTDSDSDSEDNEEYEIPKPVLLDMPQHLRKRHDHDW